MKSSKFVLAFVCIGLLGAVATQAAPAYPFPQSKQYPYGNTYTAASTSAIQKQFETWKGAWYTTEKAGNYARIISPNDSTEISVSEGIAYGMLLMVYMSSSANDYQAEFDKLWGFWKSHSISNGAQGMNWKITNNVVTGTGTATDAELDAAVALVMASKQWNNGTYLSEAQTLITWIKNNEINSNYTIKPGNSWNEAFNPSYTVLAAFKLFSKVNSSEASFWEQVISVNSTMVQNCQDATSGLMPDWCSWSGYTPVLTAASVSSGYKGFMYDAARTPWRMAWGYLWYGLSGAKTITDKINNWLNHQTYSSASYIKNLYNYDASTGYALTGLPKALESAFTGGLGLSMATADNPGYYLETIYEVLINTAGKTSPTATVGEKYYSATLNVLYLLLLTGNMPNFYDMSNYTNIVSTTARAPQQPTGTQLPLNTAFSGFTNWGAFSDKLGTGTVMYPDSGAFPVYVESDGTTTSVKADFRVAPEPVYGSTAASNNEYPFAGIVMMFKDDDSYVDLSDLATIRITIKTQGVIRLALLNSYTLVDLAQEGGEPGYWFHPSDDFQTFDIDLASVTASGAFDSLWVPSWATTPARVEVLKAVNGIKFEPKMTKGGYGSMELKSIAFLNASGNPVSNLTTGLTIRPIYADAQIKIHGNELSYQGFATGAKLSIFGLNGKQLYSAVLSSGSGTLFLNEIKLPQGVSLVKISDTHRSTSIQIQN